MRVEKFAANGFAVLTPSPILSLGRGTGLLQLTFRLLRGVL